MEQDKQALLDAFKDAESKKQNAEDSKNSAIAQLEEFKAKYSKKLEEKSLSAVESATLNGLKDDVSFARKMLNVIKSNYEMAKYKAKKAGAIVVERAVAKVTDSPEVRAIKEKISEVKKSISELATAKKEKRESFKKVVSEHKSEIANLDKQISQHKEKVENLKQEIYKLDPTQKPSKTETKDGAKKPGRKSKLAGCTISVNPEFADENPHRKGSSAFSTFNAFLEAANHSIGYEHAVATGIPAKDIALLVNSGKLVATKND